MPIDENSSDSEIQGNHWGVNEEDEQTPEITVAEDSTDETSSNSGPSPIVGIILMVAVTVLCAALIGSVSWSAPGVKTTNEPSVVVEKHPENSSITVTVSEIPNEYEYVTVEGPGKTAKIQTERTLVFERPPENSEIIVSGTYIETTGMYGTQEETHTILLYSGDVTV